jgi:hypothetical protein
VPYGVVRINVFDLCDTCLELSAEILLRVLHAPLGLRNVVLVITWEKGVSGAGEEKEKKKKKKEKSARYEEH